MNILSRFFPIIAALNIMSLSSLMAQDGQDWFVDVTETVGIKFQHRDFRSGKHYYIETTGSGAAWIDFDNDGDLDLYLLNGCPTPGSSDSTAVPNQMFENRDGRFVDVTQRSGLGDSGCGMGVCTGDYDGDGWLDLFVTNFGRDRLFRNLGNGTFKDVSHQAGVDGDLWGTSCSFGDLDGDGDLDIYVANYVDFSFENNPQCSNATLNLISYCRPTAFNGLPDYLYINQGDGSFKEESALRGIKRGKDEKGFGVILSDVDGDHDLDVIVANDGTMNRLYVNDGNGVFEDEALLAGIGFNNEGEAEAGMGVSAGDVDNNGWPDIIMTHYAMETNTLYSNQGDLLFVDATLQSGIAELSRRPVGWGVQWFDYDLDGDLDAAVANGHVMDNITLIDPNMTYGQSNSLLKNNGRGSFIDVSDKAGTAFAKKQVSRAMAAGDWNNDGRLDLLITNINDQVNLLENRMTVNGNWLGVELVGPKVNRFAIGAKVRLSIEQKLLGSREVTSGGSFMSQSDLRLLFGLGAHQGLVTIEIDWPDGKRQVQQTSDFNKYIRIKQATL